MKNTSIKRIVISLACVLGAIAFIVVGNHRQNQEPTTEASDTALRQHSDKETIEPSSFFNRPSQSDRDSLLGAVIKSNKTCSLTFSIVSTLPTVAPNAQIIRTVTVKNSSKVQCVNTSFSLYYSNNEAFVSATPAPTASNYYWNIGTLAAGAEKKVTVTTRATGALAEVVSTEGCATANRAKDACTTNAVTISGSTVPVPPTTPPTPPSTVPLAGKEYGTWVWVSPLQMSTSYTTSVLNMAKANGINVIYVTIDDYLEIAALPEGVDKDAQKAAYSTALQTVVRAAKLQGIAVDAEAGWRDWAEAGQTYKAFAIVDYVLEYNATHPNDALRGFQYDVEPYLLSSYETNKGPILTRFVQLIDETTTRLGTAPIRFGVVIPHFYDDAQAWTPAITYNGTTQHTFNHLLSILDRRAGSTIILMSYRNFSEGNNGTIQISQVEVTQANGHATKVIVGQETGNVDPAYVTYYGLTKAYYLEQVGIVQNAFKTNTGFGGIAVHYVEPFLELR